MFFQKKNKNQNVEKIYGKIVNLSRSQKFYSYLNVPDTIDGRFDMLILFTILVIHTLSKIKPKGVLLSQELFDLTFRDLDYSLREMGVGDLGVSGRIKTMISAYMGRQKVYSNSFYKNDEKGLNVNLKNNVFRNTEITELKINILSSYCFKLLKHLEKYDKDALLTGNFEFIILDDFI